MKLIIVLAAILALTLADEEKKDIEAIEDSEAAASIELLKEVADLKTAASTYNYVPPSQRPTKWQNNNLQQQTQNTWQQQQNNWQQQTQNTWQQQQNNWQQPQNNWQQPQNNWQQPQNTWEPPKQPALPGNVQNDYYWGSSTYAPVNRPTTTTTPVSVIKNEQYIGDNGNYYYEYQLGDGTHVGEQGYYNSPTKEDESLVKKGWWSYVGADGKTYTVTYWADSTGFHAYGDHLPTPPPVPAAIQAALDKEKEKPQNNYPTQTPAPQPIKPTQPTYVPTQQPYPSQPTYTTQRPTYNPTQQPTYYPQQPTYYPSQQPAYNPPQQTYYPQQQQQSYYPQQQNNYVPQYNK